MSGLWVNDGEWFYRIYFFSRSIFFMMTMILYNLLLLNDDNGKP